MLVPLNSGTRSYFQKCRNPTSVIGFRRNHIELHTLAYYSDRLSASCAIFSWYTMFPTNTMADDTLQHCPPLPCRHQQNGAALVWHSLLLCQNWQSLLRQHQQNGTALAWHSLLLCQHPLAGHCHSVWQSLLRERHLLSDCHHSHIVQPPGILILFYLGGQNWCWMINTLYPDTIIITRQCCSHYTNVSLPRTSFVSKLGMNLLLSSLLSPARLTKVWWLFFDILLMSSRG